MSHVTTVNLHRIIFGYSMSMLLWSCLGYTCICRFYYITSAVIEDMIKRDTVCTVSLLIQSHHSAARLHVSDTGVYPPDMKGIPLSVTNKMQRYTIFFIAVNAQHVSSGFFRPSSGAQTVHTTSGTRMCQACLLLPLVWVSWHCQLTLTSGSSKQAWHIPDAVCTVWAPDDGRKTRLKHVEHWQQ